MANVTQISLESLLLRATNPNNTNLDSAAVEAFFALVNKERDGPAIGVKVIASRLPVGTEKEVLSTLNVLDMCMSKCGTAFQSEVGKFRFLNEMIKLVSPKYLGSKTPLTVKQRVLQLLYLWTLDYPKEVKIKEAFDMLRKQGVIREIPNPNIPQEALGFESKKRVTNSIFQDEEKSNILRKLLQSKDPEDIQAANWLIKSMVKEEEKMSDLKSKAVTELESVQNNLRLLNEMMGSYKKGVTTASELDLMKELYDNLVRLSPNLAAIACETEHCPVDLVESVIKTMDDLTECCTKYKTKILGEKSDNSQSNLASLLELDQQAVGSKTPSLIQMNQRRESKSSIDDCFDDCSCSSQNASQTSQISTNSKSSMDVLCDVFSGLGDVPASSEILQPVTVSNLNGDKLTERDKDKHKMKALEDLDVLGEHLLKENLPTSNYRNHDKIPMNLLTKINEIKKSQQLANSNTSKTHASSESLKLDLNYLLEIPSDEKSNLSQNSYKSDENLSQNDSADDCLVDISEDSCKVTNGQETEDKKADRSKESQQRNGDLAGEIIEKLNVEGAGEGSRPVIVKERDDKANSKVNSSALSTNLKDIAVKLEDIKPSSKKSIVALDEKNGLTVMLHLAKDRPRPGVSVYVVTTISRNEMPLSNYYFQAVVPKDCKLKLQPPSATDLPAFNPFIPPAAITQIMLLAHPDKSDITLKYVISYLMDDDTVTEMGEVESLPLSESFIVKMSKRTSLQASLFTYFTKAQKTNTASDSSTSARPIVSEASTSSSFSTCTEISEVRPEESNLLIHHFDLGNHVGNKLDDDLKFKLLSTPWTPGKDFKFPVSVSGKKNLRFQRQWLDRYPWLVYTKNDGALCKYCVIFSHDTVGKGGNQASKSLVTVPYKKWKHAIEDFESHQSKQYHHEAVVKGSYFLKTMQNRHLDIRNVIDSGRRKQVEENREKLFSIVETIKFCGRQELALRGTNDSGPVSVTDEEPVTNDGNFRAILRMRMKCGDTKLLKHSENIALNATYMSAKVQNDLISICGEIIQKEIVKCLNEAKVFSVLVDETADISGHEQLSLCVRYTKKVETCYVVKEDFLGFVKVDNTTAQPLADTIIASLKNLHIDCNNMVGQGYDGAAVMKGAFNGVQAIIRKSFPRALFVHCSSHSLNLALCHSCSVPPIRNCIGTVKAIGNFLRASPKRTSFLQARIRANFPDATWQKLTPMCETRWVENHNGLLKFKQIFKSIIETLEQFSTDPDMETSTKASTFLKSALASEFVVSLCFLAKVFAATLTVCKVLQSPLCDLITAVDHIENVISHFQDIRSNIEKEFSNSFIEAKDLLADVNEEIKLPRLTSVQKHRANPNTNNPEQYYRITVAIPLLEDLTSQLKIRFTDHKKVIAAMFTLIPTVCSEKETPFPREDLVMYEDLVELDEAQGEFQLWKLLWQGKSPSDRPSCAIEAVGECNRQLYPNIYMLLNILSTLPVTTCTPERSFSTLRRLKTYLRNSCGQERLTGLALMAIHRDVIIPTDDVITEFANKKSRRLDFVL